MDIASCEGEVAHRSSFFGDRSQPVNGCRRRQAGIEALQKELSAAAFVDLQGDFTFRWSRWAVQPTKKVMSRRIKAPRAAGD